MRQPEPPFPWLLAYDSDVEGNDEIYGLPIDGDTPINLSKHPAEDRYPAWSPDGRWLAFQSQRDGNWEIYTLELDSGETTRLTFHIAYDGAPAWSPDGAAILFESYRDTGPCPVGTPTASDQPCPDLEIYRVPAQGGAPQRLTESPGGDIQPAPSPDGKWIAFTSWRTGQKQVYVMPAAGGPARQVTDGSSWSPAWTPEGSALILVSERDGTPELYRQPLDAGPALRLTENAVPEERPSLWSNGALLYARYDPGPPFETDDPYYPGNYHLYRLTEDSVYPARARRPAAAPTAVPSLAVIPALAETGELPQTAPSNPVKLNSLEGIEGPDLRLVSGVDQAYFAWREAVRSASGHDFLGRVSDVFRPAGYYGHRLGYLSWHKTGRAVDLLFDWYDAKGQRALVIVREDLAGEVYWRLFLRCALQDGSLGTPLTVAPWQFWWHASLADDPDRFATGGRRLPIPTGYYVDVTALAARYGWSRIASYHLEDFSWKRDSTATEYWHYQHTDGLTWYQAMAQIYPPEQLAELFSRPVAATRQQTDAVINGKDLPTSP
jgi:TolB protein